MSIDYYGCEYCDKVFPDTDSDIVFCDECGKAWCSVDCAECDGTEYDSTDICISCNYCREEDFNDDKLLEFALKQLNLCRSTLIERYKEYYNRSEFKG